MRFEAAQPSWRYRNVHNRVLAACTALLVHSSSNFPFVAVFAVPRESIQALWQEFNLCADGWGVDPAFFDQLCQAITASMGVDPDERAARALFAAFDTDEVT